MAVISLISAKGSPGATTLAVALALSWGHRHPERRTLLVDADPVGGDVAAGVLRGGAPSGSGMLALAAGRGRPAGELLVSACVPLTEGGSVAAVVGVPDSQRAGALPPAWAVIEAALAERGGVDLVVDAGRLDSPLSAGPWLLGSDRVLLIVRPGLPSVASARRLAAAWTGTPVTAGVPVQLVVVDSASPYSPREVAGAVGLPLAATIPFEAQHAATYSAGAPATRGMARSRFARSVDGLADRLDAELSGRAGLASAGVASAGLARTVRDRVGSTIAGAGGRG